MFELLFAVLAIVAFANFYFFSSAFSLQKWGLPNTHFVVHTMGDLSLTDARKYIRQSIPTLDNRTIEHLLDVYGGNLFHLQSILDPFSWV